VIDYAEHGSHVSGIIAAEHSDTVAHGDTYVEGMAPRAKILPLAFLGPDGSGNISDAVIAIDYAVSRGVQVINASWGGSVCSQALRDRIQQLENKNILFVAAAGNDRLNIDVVQEYPGSFPFASQITVGSTDSYDEMSSFSNYGDIAVDLFAPGSLVTSTIPGNQMAAFSGTSMATPFVTGAVALLKGAMPSASIAEIRQALFSSTYRPTNTLYRNASEGRLDLTNALQTLQQIHGTNASH
jgi:subtilisin family serine protease